MFSCEFYQISKSTFFHRTPLVAASVTLSIKIPGRYQLDKYFTNLRSPPNAFWRIPIPKKLQNLQNLPAMESFFVGEKETMTIIKQSPTRERIYSHLAGNIC